MTPARRALSQLVASMRDAWPSEQELLHRPHGVIVRENVVVPVAAGEAARVILVQQLHRNSPLFAGGQSVEAHLRNAPRVICFF